MERVATIHILPSEHKCRKCYRGHPQTKFGVIPMIRNTYVMGICIKCNIIRYDGNSTHKGLTYWNSKLQECWEKLDYIKG